MTPAQGLAELARYRGRSTARHARDVGGWAWRALLVLGFTHVAAVRFGAPLWSVVVLGVGVMAAALAALLALVVEHHATP